MEKAKLDMEKEMKELSGSNNATSSKDCTPKVVQQVDKGYPKFSRFSGEEPKPKSEATFEKGTSRQRSGKGAIRERFPLQKPCWEKTKLTIRYLYHKNIS